jgi:hypothetical protein
MLNFGENLEMFEKEIKFIGDFCFNQVTKLGTHFTLEKIIEAGVHPAVTQYIGAELDFMIFSDRRRLLQQSYFDYTGKEISDHFQKISNEIKKNKKISQEDAKKLIFQAVSFNVNYLVRPRWSLVKLIFNEQPLVPVEEMKMMLNYLYYYDYFRNVLSGYLSKRKIFQISSSEFDIILSKIDKELTDSNRKLVIENAFMSMGDFFNIGGVDKNLVLLTAIEIFFKEKSLLELLLKLRKAIPNGGKKQFDKNELERIIFSPETKKQKGSQTDLDTQSNGTAEEKIESEPTPAGPENESLDDIEKAEGETFLTPEEEQALLSLYNDELKETAETTEMQIEPTLSDLTEEHITEEESIQIEESLLDFNTNLDAEAERVADTFSVELPEEESVPEIFSDENIEAEDTITDEQLNSILSGREKNLEEDRDLFKPGVEKEIVQEMIKDFYGESEQDAEKHNEELKESDVIEGEGVDEQIKNRMESLEDELLNIFEDLDKENVASPEADKRTEDVKNDLITSEEKNIKEEQSSAFVETDAIDELIKSINEAVYSEDKKSVVEPEKKIEVAHIVEAPVNKIEPVIKEEPPKTIFDKPIIKPREFRSKDLFSYLRKKDVKKIILLIFANDEEDFVNTTERIMDSQSYKEASEILKAVFTSYKISPYSKEAITFTNAVSNYFRQI